MLLVTLAALTFTCQDGARAGGVQLFADGARIVWAGDSITHSCLFTQYIETYAYTRYPDRKLLFVNCGVNGDRTADVLLRFDRDVAPWKPTRVVVCLGMNDGAFVSFDAALFARFKKHMGLLLDSVAQAGAVPVVLTPPPADPTHGMFILDPALRRLKISASYLRVLARYSAFLESEAKRRRVPFADVFRPLNRHAERLRVVNPGATLVPDRIHPGYTGSALIAIHTLAALGEPQERFAVRIAPASASFSATGRGAKVSAIERTRAGLRFTLEAPSLPWVLPVEARGACTLAPEYAAFNTSTLAVVGLDDEDYTLFVGGTEVLTRTAAEWARGVDLGLALRHPDWLQAERVAAENSKRNGLIRLGVRELWRTRREITDLEARGATGTPEYEKLRAHREQLERGLVRVGERIVAHNQAIERLARPMARRYELRRARP